MKKLEKYNTVSECNKEHLKTAKVDQIIECFPNTLLKLLPNTIQKTKWSKKSKDCSPSNPMLINDRCKLTAWDGLYHDFWERFIQAKKVEVPDVVMAIHPHLEGEFWGPTVDLLLDENVVTAFTAFNEEHFKQALERLDYVFAKYIFKGMNPWVSGHVKQTPHDPNMIWASNQYLIVFKGRTVDMK